jgi:hypothetical protein
VRVQDPHASIEVKPNHFDRALEVAVVAHDQRRLERSPMREINKIDGEAHVRSLLGGQLDLDLHPSDARWPCCDATTPRLHELAKMDRAIALRMKRTEMGVLRLWETRIRTTVKKRRVQMYGLDAKKACGQDGAGETGEIDPMAREQPARAVHQVQSVDKDMGAQWRHRGRPFRQVERVKKVRSRLAAARCLHG